MQRKTKIVATLGPACDDEETLGAMYDAGMDVARINLSHGSRAQHQHFIHLVQDLRAQLCSCGRPLSIMLDTRGPEVRLAGLEREVEVKDDSTLYLARAHGGDRQTQPAGEPVLRVNMPRMLDSVSVGDRIWVDDGRVRFRVQQVCEGFVRLQAQQSGRILPGKKVSFPDSKTHLPFLSEEDMVDLKMVASTRPDWLAVSFVSEAGDILQIRDALAEAGGRAEQPIVAKIESAIGYDNLKSILQVADAVMVARGDLGVDCPPERVPLMQKNIIDRCRAFGTPVITATQMLESMIDSPVATRAEASDVANAILDGTDAVMLSGETAAGQHPVKAVETISKIIETTESWQMSPERRRSLVAARTDEQPSVTEAVAESAVTSAERLSADAILAATHSGYTARMVAKYRPSVPVIAVTPNHEVRQQLALVWGIHPLLTEGVGPVFEESRNAALDAGLVSPGDLVVVTSGQPAPVARSTNTMQIYRIGRLILQGSGVGRKTASGRASIQQDDEFAPEAGPGVILVISSWNPALLDAAREAAAIVAQEGGLSSPAALVGLELGIPVLVGAKNATEIIGQGQHIVVDAARGAVWVNEPAVFDSGEGRTDSRQENRS